MKPSFIDLSKKPQWFEKNKRSIIGSPYTLKESLEYLYYLLSFPIRIKKTNISLPPKKLYLNNDVEPQLTLTFAGDIMPLHGKKIFISPSVRDFLQKSDYLIANFEGIITSEPKSYFLAQKHSLTTLKILSKIFPPRKTILNLANNHSADFGEKAFQKTKKTIRNTGFKTIGTLDNPSLIINKNINVTGLTFLSNQPTNFVFPYHFIDQGYNDQCSFNVLFPHWGYEMQLFPEMEQKRLAYNLLEKWDAIIGHHPHCIQPIDIYRTTNKQKIIAYSLGNLIFTQRLLRSHQNGLLLQLTIGPSNNGSWGINKMVWKITQIARQREEEYYLSIIPKLNYISIEKN
jgi:hypothetical protein